MLVQCLKNSLTIDSAQFQAPHGWDWSLWARERKGSVRPQPWENPFDGVGVVAYKASAY